MSLCSSLPQSSANVPCQSKPTPTPLLTSPSAIRRPHSPSPQTSTKDSRIYDIDSDDDYDALSLPFPAPLPRADFLAPTFDPSAYLSSLGPRPQTLEDLRTDLRQRSQLLTEELLELVNARYEDFLGLGGSVAGGGEKVEEVRVGLMGLRREVDSVRTVVLEKEKLVEDLLRERTRGVREREWGRAAVRFWEGVGRLERTLGVAAANGTAKAPVENGEDDEESEDSFQDDDDDDDDDYEDDNEDDDTDGLESDGTVPLPRLRRRVDELLALERLAHWLDPRHPFVAAQQHRLLKIRNTLLVDLNTTLRRAKGLDGKASGGTLKVLELYRKLDAGKDAIDIFKRLPRR